ncbi:MAG: PAS domain S-box protein [Thermoguttaceae bacterium]
MNIILFGIAVPLAARLRETLLARGYDIIILRGGDELSACLKHKKIALAILGIDEAIEKTIDICRQIRDIGSGKSVQIILCGKFDGTAQIQRLLSAGADDFLFEIDNQQELELRLALAEHRLANGKNFSSSPSASEASADLALHQSQQNLQNLFDSLQDMVCVLDEGGQILYANPMVGRRLGYSAEELSCMNVGELHPPERVEEAQAIFSRILAGQTPLCEIPLQTKSGSQIPVQTLVARGKWAGIDAVFGVTRDLSELHRMMVENLIVQQQAAAAIQQEQQLLRKVIDEQERERRLAAYEIHDGIAQQITSSLLHLEAFQRLHDINHKQAQESFNAAMQLLTQSADEARRLISGLRPLILDEYGIIEAIDYLVCEKSGQSDMRITFLHDVHFQRLIAPLETAVFRIIQEAIDNACRHSRSEVVTVEVIDNDKKLYIKICDQGIGFDLNAVEDTRFGLRSIREYARLLGGRAEIHSTPGSGTSIAVELPIASQNSGS